MTLVLSLCLALSGIASASRISDNIAYYNMTPMYELDNFNECLSDSGGTFCMGSFLLQPHSDHGLWKFTQEYSRRNCNFNRMQIYRGYCMNSRCGETEGSSIEERFERCVAHNIRQEYRLGAKLLSLDYCRTAEQQTWRPVDSLDVTFAVIAGIILIANILGTAYDVMRSPDAEPNKYLLSWSVKQNWAHLTTAFENGDHRIMALKPVHGIKAITLMKIILAHSVLMYHFPFISDPLALEKACHHPILIFIQNGTAIVQTFIMSSSFLLAYNLLVRSEANPHKWLRLRFLPKYLLSRVFRILPVYVFVLGFALTWWSHLGDGPLWGPFVGGEYDRCRDKWWTHLLFLNHLIRPDVKCLTHTWFLAVEMQLYVVNLVLTLMLGASPRRALNVLAGLFAAAVTANFLIAYRFQLGSMLTIMIPRCMHVLFTGERSFMWLYQSPWNNLPSSLIGVFVAFLHFYLQKKGLSPKNYLWFRVLYRASVPGMYVWVFLGYWIKHTNNAAAIALFAATDRATLTTLIAIALIGFIYQIDSLWWRFLSWRGWEVADRMSLSVYLLHWLHSLGVLAVKSHAAPAALHHIGTHFLWTTIASYLTAVPLFVCLERPMQKFLQILFFNKTSLQEKTSRNPNIISNSNKKVN